MPPKSTPPKLSRRFWIVATTAALRWLGPISLALLVNVAKLKRNPAFSWIALDLTLLCAAIVILLVVIAALTRRGTNHLPWAPWVLLVCFSGGLVAASFEGYSLSKVVVLLVVSFGALTLGPLYLLRGAFERSLFVGALLLTGVFGGLCALLFPTSTPGYDTTRLIIEGSNTIATARLVGSALLICLICIFVKRYKLRWQITLALVAIPLVIVLFLTGSKGSLLSLIFAIVATLLISPVFRGSRARSLIAIGIASLAVGVWVLTSRAEGVSRILDFLSGEEGTSALARLRYWQESLVAISAHPFGLGWGDLDQIHFFAKVAGDGGRVYSHNVALELLAEGGWVAGLAGMIYIVATILRGNRLVATPTNAAIFALALFSLANAMVSGDLNDNRLMWATFAAIWAGSLAKPATGESWPARTYNRTKRLIRPKEAGNPKAIGPLPRSAL